MVLPLHKTKGINAHLTVCQRCGEGVGLALMGAYNTVGVCECGVTMYGATGSAKCPSCGQVGNYHDKRRIEEYEKLPGGLCDKCREEDKEHAAVVAAGGVYFRCMDCGHRGVVKGTAPLAKFARRKLKIKKPAPCGIEFNKTNCPLCGSKNNG